VSSAALLTDFFNAHRAQASIDWGTCRDALTELFADLSELIWRRLVSAVPNQGLYLHGCVYGVEGVRLSDG